MKKPRKKNIGSEPRAKDPVGLRIIGGTYRGSKLLYCGDNRVRPMKDRVREALFNLIGPEIRGKHVLDLFTGTGALAIEAISRGAVFATMIEIHLPTAKNARLNLESLPLGGCTELFVQDAFYWARTRENFRSRAPWVVFASPPYEFYVSKKNEMLEMLHILYQAAPADSIFVLESDERFDFQGLPAEIPVKKRRSYPPAEIGIFYK